MTSSILRVSVVLLAPLLALLPAAGAYAQSVVYRCVDKEGRVLYTDTNAGSCKVVDSIISGAISAPPASSRAPAAGMRQGAGRAASPAAAPTASPANFPRVDNATQRARDDDRREILNEELRAEEKKLPGQREELRQVPGARGPDARRHRPRREERRRDPARDRQYPLT
jgi:hypothetical protein